MRTATFGIIILAAGASVRFGKPKQLLPLQDETLLRRAGKIALAVSGCVVVTLGAKIEIMRNEIDDLPIKIIENKDWQSGMSGSIKVGLESIMEDKRINAVIVTVCDQPFVGVSLLEKIAAKFQETNAPIVACEYQNSLGVPALFGRKLFPELLALDAQIGAKHLIKKYASHTVAISFPEGAYDIDTPEDYEKLLKIFAEE